MWVLPAYVPAIGAPKAPWIALASTQDGSPVAARLVQDQWGPDATPWHVELHGSPGVMVSVLVKGARILDTKTGWEDRTGQDLWVMPPQTRATPRRQ
ncbi:Uncharacterised protein [Actinomyces bovis]|uniref:Uncharacterized protein n=2 Tax=Actinomyces bovis TaxID=1658 RepID=A0ABY1VNR1_9ACTO|nr:Uncharacterised protein [Actinomyces bovis]